MSKLPHIVAASLVVPARAFAQIVIQEPAHTPAASKAGNGKSYLDNIEYRAEDVTGSRLKRQHA